MLTSYRRQCHPEAKLVLVSVRDMSKITESSETRKRALQKLEAKRALLQMNIELEEGQGHRREVEVVTKKKKKSGRRKKKKIKYRCRFCPASFKTMESLENHFMTVHQGNVDLDEDNGDEEGEMLPKKVRNWDCVFCGKSLRSYSDNAKHILSHIREKPHFCKLCDMSFSHKQRLKTHRIARHPASGKDERQRNFGCDLCNKLFFTKQTRDMHQLTHSIEKPYQCDLCPAKFRLPSYLESHREKCHLASGERQKRFRCEICNKLFFTKQIRDRHQLTHSIEKPYQCGLCPAKFRLPSYLESHREKCHLASGERQKRFGCEICKKLFFTKNARDQHQLTHSTEKPYQCDLCPAKFRLRRYLESHRKRCHPASGEKQLRFRCDICKKSFFNKYLRDEHQLIHSTESLYQCDLCPAKFKQRQYLTKHRNVRHRPSATDERQRKFGCDICNKLFFTKQARDKHQLTHSTENPYECDLCPAKFKVSLYLQNHRRRRHTASGDGQKSFKCDICKKLFLTEYARDNHQLTHSTEKPYQCDLCHEKFKVPLYLEIHRKKRHLASGERQKQMRFRCVICKKLFFDKYFRDRHQLTHSNKRSYQCDLCPAKFKLPLYLKKHMKRHQTPSYNCEVCGTELLRNMLTSHRRQCHPEAKLVMRKETDASETVWPNLIRDGGGGFRQTGLEAKRDLQEMDIKLEEVQNQAQHHTLTYRLGLGLNYEVTLQVHDHDHPNLNDNHDDQRRQDDNNNLDATEVTKKKKENGRRKKKVKYKCRFCPEFFRTMESLENHFMTVHKGNVDLDEDNDDYDDGKEEHCPVLLEVPVVLESKQETDKHPARDYKVVPDAEGGDGGEIEIQNWKRNKEKEKGKSPLDNNLLTSFFPIECVMQIKAKKS